MMSNSARLDVAGIRTYYGGYSRDQSWTDRFSVLSNDGNTIIVRYEGSARQWSSRADHYWINVNGGTTNQGEVSPQTCDYTIDLVTFKVIKASGSNSDFEGEVGYPPWFIINPQVVSLGSKVFGQRSPNALLTVSSSQRVRIKGVDLDTWVATGTNQTTGEFRLVIEGNNYPSYGPKTVTLSYDKIYGINVVSSLKGNFEFELYGEGWKEWWNATGRISDTNIDLSQLTIPSVRASSQSYLMAGIMALGVVTLIVGIIVLRWRDRTKPASTVVEPQSPASQPQPVVSEQPVSEPPREAKKETAPPLASTPLPESTTLSSFAQPKEMKTAITEKEIKEPDRTKRLLVYCIHCGAPILGVAKFCRTCGKPQE